jgi:predicted metal-dependent HD superfamily phosphohydrolase
VLEPVFTQLLLHCTDDTRLAEQLWHELLKKYSGRPRYYRNLGHLEHMYRELLPVKSSIEDWNTVLFALFYHDAVYNPLCKDNEIKSVKLALTRLRGILPADQRFKCFFLILATTDHAESDSSDINLFIDADLSIFGQDWEIYTAYAKNIRKEYAFYPDFMYNRGRKRALQHFLQMERIFKTQHFFEKYEEQARLNLQTELKQLRL